MYSKNFANDEMIQRIYKDPAGYYDLYTVLDGIFNQTTSSIYMVKKLLNTIEQLKKNKRLIVTIVDILLISLCYLKQNQQVLIPENIIKETTGVRTLRKEDVYENSIRINIKKDGSFLITGKNKQNAISASNLTELQNALMPFNKLLLEEKKNSSANNKKTEAIVTYGNEGERFLPDKVIIKLKNIGLENINRQHAE